MRMESWHRCSEAVGVRYFKVFGILPACLHTFLSSMREKTEALQRDVSEGTAYPGSYD